MSIKLVTGIAILFRKEANVFPVEKILKVLPREQQEIKELSNIILDSVAEDFLYFGIR